MRRLALLAMTGLLAMAFAFPAGTAAAKPATGGLLTDVPVTGTTTAGPFSGVLDITGVTRDGSTLLFDGTLTDSATGVVTSFQDVAGTLQQGGTQAVCDILFLDLGPIFLDVLGLQVNLSRIILDINAVPGAGNLLGNLLCAVVGLLDGDPLGGALGRLLDRLIALLNNLLG